MQGSNQSRIVPDNMFVVIDVTRAQQLGFPIDLLLQTAIQGILLNEELYRFVNKEDYIRDNSNLKGGNNVT